MGNYDPNVQKNIDKMSEFGMIPRVPRISKAVDPNGECEVENCVRAMEYLQRIVKSLLRQMNVNSHVFGPGEAITIDLRAELKYDDYVILTKFMNSQYESDKYLYRIDEIMSNFIHVVEHTASRFDFLESIIRFPAFYSLKFWMILSTSMVIGSLIVMLFIKAFNTRSVHIQLFYGFLIIFILSCVWSFSQMYEDKKAEAMAQMVQTNGLPPKDCDYQNYNSMEGMWYWIRVHMFQLSDECGQYYANTMTDPLWKVNPMEAISQSVAYFFFTPLGYIGGKLGAFVVHFVAEAPYFLKPFMFVLVVLLAILMLYGPFRIRTPLLTIEPAWGPAEVPALERNNMHAIDHERIRNEIMERPDRPVMKSIRNASTDMDGFKEYLADEEGRNDEEIIIGPFPRFNKPEQVDSCSLVGAPTPSTSTKNNEEDKLPCASSNDTQINEKDEFNISSKFREELELNFLLNRRLSSLIKDKLNDMDERQRKS